MSFPRRCRPWPRRSGYRTAGFLANPLLHPDNGFARGFDDFHTPPTTFKVLREPGRVDARTVNQRAIPWLEEHAGRPGEGKFFLYLHYIDPHNPYANPDIPDGKTPYDPGYDGPVRGTWVDDLAAGQRRLLDRKADVRYLTALYDSEIHFVDRHVGEVLRAIPPAVLSNTLVVLAADHGEELFDRGGWKHGQTLYEEMLHVPFIARWDGRIPANRRLAGTVRMIDLFPTLVEAAGGRPAEGLAGESVLPELLGERPLPRRPAFAQHMSYGPLRGSVTYGPMKLILFNRQTPFAPPNHLHAHLWRLDVARLHRIELYDLKSDPGERHDLAGERPEEVSRLAPLVEKRLDLRLEGLRVVAAGVPKGSSLVADLTLDRPPASWLPYFLGEGDHVKVDGAHVRMELTGGAIPKGVLFRGDLSRIVSVEAHLQPGGAPVALHLAGRAHPVGGAIDVAAVRGRGPWAAAGPTLEIWSASGPAATTDSKTKDETLERLRALGYVG
jgi:arylsulfatase A-like enzyme